MYKVILFTFCLNHFIENNIIKRIFSKKTLHFNYILLLNKNVHKEGVNNG